MSQLETPGSETPERIIFDVDARADQAKLEVLRVATLGRIKQLLEEYPYWDDTYIWQRTVLASDFWWKNWQSKKIGIIVRYMKQDLEQMEFDFWNYIWLSQLPEEIRNLVIRTAYICGKTTGSIHGKLSNRIKTQHLNWFNGLISPKDADDLMGTLMWFELHGRIESVIYAIQEWRESEKIPQFLDWKTIYDASDLFYWACEKNHITKADVAEFLGAYESSL